MVDRVIRIVVDGRAAKKGVNQVKGDLRQLDKAAGDAAKNFRGLGAGLAGLAVAFGAKAILDQARAWQDLNGALSLVTLNASDLLKVQNELFEVANATKAPIAATADLYIRLSRSTDFAQERILALTTTISQAVALSKATPEAAKAALFQLGQGFAAGALRGEELNSVMEQTPELAKAMADGLGITIGELRKLGAQGKLTAELVAEGLENSAARVAAEFGSIPLTVSQAITQVGNETLRFIGKMDDATNATAILASGISSLARGIRGLSLAFGSEFGFGPDGDKLEVQIVDLQDRIRELQQIANGGTVSTGPGQFSFRFIDPDEAADAAAQIAGIENALITLKRIQLDVIANGGIFPDPAADAARAAEKAEEVARLAAIALAEEQAIADKLVASFATVREKAIEQLKLVNDFIAAGLITGENIELVRGRLDDIINPLTEIDVDVSKREIDALGTFILAAADNADDLRAQIEAFSTGGQKELDSTIAFQQARDILADYTGDLEITEAELTKLILTEQVLAETLAEVTQDIAAQADVMDDFFTRARENSQDILSGFLESGLQDLDNFESAFADMLLSLASQALAAAIFNKILGPSDGSGSGGIINTAVDFFGGIFGGGQFGRGVQAGQAVTVGEGGRFNREAFVPNQGGTIVPLGMDRGGGGMAAAPIVNNTIINTIDEADITGAFQDGAGDTVLLNRVSVKRTAFRRALGI